MAKIKIIKQWWFWVIILLLALITIKLFYPDKWIVPKPVFCGESTHAYCSTDDDCFETGCSNEVCASRSQGKTQTSCFWRTCYNNERFDLTCQCINDECQWD